MKKYICLLPLLLLPYVLFSTENDKKKEIGGSVVDAITKERIDSVRVELMRTDSTVIDTAYTQWSFYALKVNDGKHILRLTHPGYETVYKDIDVKFYRREMNRYVGKTEMFKKIHTHQLGEVTVKATRIKFYVNGDTLVYNADAFQLSEGSMLDALIKQLPGAELKSDGRIFMNGKYIESMLLNGKEFFKGDNKVLLKNLPAYMVGKVKVYEKEGDMSKTMGRDANDKKLVIDVQLKRDYSFGWISNMEVGTGSNNRYLGKVFGSLFTSRLHLSVFGNDNNLGDMQEPGENSESTPVSGSRALITTKSAGVNYNYENTHNLNIDGAAQVIRTNTNEQNNVNSVNFLSGGDTYGRSLSDVHTNNTGYNLSNTISWFNSSKGGLFFMTNLMYSKANTLSNSLSATFSDEPSKYFNKGLIDSIYTSNPGSLMRKIAINRNVSNAIGNNHSLTLSTNMMSMVKMPHSNDYISLTGNFTYTDQKNNNYSHSRLDYPSNSSSPTDARNQYNTTPGKNYNYMLRAEYWYNVSSRLSIVPYYGYGQSYQSSISSLYRLDGLAGWKTFDSHELGSLPSTADSLQLAIDAKNSYYSRGYNYSHDVGSDIHWRLGKKGKNEMNFDVQLPFHLDKNQLVYQRASLDTTLTRNVGLFSPGLRISKTINGWKKSISLDYRCNSSAPSMNNLLNVRDDSNPLYVTLGNPNLKNTRSHNMSLSYRNISDDQRIFNVSTNYGITQNAVAMGYVYDKATGIRTTKPDNINGNWNGTADVNYTCPLDAKKLFTFNTGTNGQYEHNVDLVSVAGSNTGNRSTVQSLYLTQSLECRFHRDKLSLNVISRCKWTHSESAREDFNTINAADFNYGFSGQVEFPWNMQLNMDLTEYGRRGYEDHNMNTNELIWNARLSQQAMHGNLIFVLDGFDILSNLSNVQRTINAQGRVETYYNVLPRYLLFHVIYRLNKQPKKHKD